MYLRITIREGAQDVLVGFPFRESQHIDQEWYAEDQPGVIIVDLADSDDTTVHQEKYLDSQPDVISYTVAAE